MASTGGNGPHIDLVPIVDAMTCVIFFLILSSTFIELTKITLPPSQVQVSSDNVSTDIPLESKLFLLLNPQEKLQVVMSWKGSQPGFLTKEVPREDINKKNHELEQASIELIQEFKKTHSELKHIMIGMSSSSNYQEMISMMDGVRKFTSDIVLVSPQDESNIRELFKK